MSRRGQVTAIAYSTAGAAALLGVYTALDGNPVNPAVWLVTAVFYMLVLLPAAWSAGRAYDRLRMKAMQDDLTRAWNRAYVAEVMPKLLRRAAKRGRPLTVSLIDINDFKVINDTFGHQAGDQVLLLIADTLRGCAAKGDIVARWGGDEFVFICPGGKWADGAPLDAAIDSALDKLSQRVGRRVSASVGTAAFPQDGSTLHALLRIADERMYEDKECCKGSDYNGQTMLQA